MYKRYIPTCRCGVPEGVRVVLNNYAHVGLTTTAPEGENFRDSRPLSVENLYCPQCGAPREVIEEAVSRRAGELSGRGDEKTGRREARKGRE